MHLIKNYHEIKTEFESIISQVTNQEFNVKITILPYPQIYEYTHGNSAAFKKRFILKDEIWIREMPIPQMFYELSHEAGHAMKPYFGDRDIDAEETKACLFQQLFCNQIYKSDFNWLEDFALFKTLRLEHIKHNSPKYLRYHEAASDIAFATNQDFNSGSRYINDLLLSLNR